VTAVWFEYDLLVNEQIRWDLFIILSASALAKLGSMVYFRLKQ